MSEENRWDEDLPEVNENVPTEEKPLDTFGNTDTGSAADNSTENIDIAQKPMAHPYSAGRRMQENGYGNGTNSSNFQNNTSFQEKPKYAHYEVHQPQAGNYAGGSIPPKKPHKPKIAHGGGNGGFGKKAATAVALAVIFGLVAGAVFQGVNIAADKYRDNNSSSTQIGKTETVTGTEKHRWQFHRIQCEKHRSRERNSSRSCTGDDVLDRCDHFCQCTGDPELFRIWNKTVSECGKRFRNHCR